MATGSNQNRNRETAREHMHPRAEMPGEYQLTVRQPPQLRSLIERLDALDKIAERVSEDRSADLGAGGAQARTTSEDTGVAGAMSLRQRAIQSLPPVLVMRRKLTRHLQREVRQLEKRAKRLARSARRGSAYLLNELYARIRKIQALIADLAEVAAEVVERLYIRLFIDHQQVV